MTNHVLATCVLIVVMAVVAEGLRNRVTSNEKEAAIREINHLRWKETQNSAGGPVPDVVWDPMLAILAKEHVDLCYYNKPDDREIDGKYEDMGGSGSVGELMAKLNGSPTLSDALDLWDDEGYLYHYDTMVCYGTDCYNYQQLVYRETTRMGCAREMCGGYQYIVCLFNKEFDRRINQRPF